MSKHLLRGRIRLSTVLIALVFIATLAIYLLVRPTPAEIDPLSDDAHAGLSVR